MPATLRRFAAAAFFATASLGLVGPIVQASAQDATATPMATAETTGATTDATATPEATTPMATATPEGTPAAATPAPTTGATAAPTATPPTALAQTGSETTTLAMLGIVLVGSGFAAVSLSRRAN